MNRHVKKPFSFLTLLLGMLLLSSSCQKKTNSPSSLPSKEVLYVLHSERGHFQLQSGEDTQGQLFLEGVNSSVAFFKDSQSKETGSRNLSEFLSNWNQEPNAFSDHPPTAALVYHREDANGGSQTTYRQINMIINHPRYNASTDEVVFDFQLCGQPIHLPLGEMLETTLFIDGKAQSEDSAI